MPKLRSLLPVVSCLALALYAIGVTWGSGYATPYYRERLVEGYVRRDPLFHAALAGMIDTYGVASTGLDGLPAFGYHTGSHWLAAALARLMGLSTLEVYHLVYPLLLPVLFFTSFLWLVHTLRPRYSALFWVVLLIGLVGVLPYLYLQHFKLEPRSILSESNALAFSLVFVTAALMLRGAWQRGWFLYLALPALCFTIGISKQSALYLMAAALAWLWWRLRCYRQPRYLLAAALVGLASGLAYLGTRGTYATMSFAPFDLFGYFEGSPLVWFTLNYGLTILYLALRGRKAPRYDVEVLLVLCIAGMLPAFLLQIPGASGLYFLELQRYAALALVLARLPARVTLPVKVIITGALVLAVANIALGVLLAGLNQRAKHEAPLPPALADRVLTQLEEIDAQPGTALYIPRSHPYWRLLGDEWACGTIPFLAPAVTGLALIGGLPDTNCENAVDYGYHSYTPHDETVCQTAQRYDLRRVIVLNDLWRESVMACD